MIRYLGSDRLGEDFRRNGLLLPATERAAQGSAFRCIAAAPAL
jgi:hypothetical protein